MGGPAGRQGGPLAPLQEVGVVCGVLPRRDVDELAEVACARWRRAMRARSVTRRPRVRAGAEQGSQCAKSVYACVAATPGAAERARSQDVFDGIVQRPLARQALPAVGGGAPRQRSPDILLTTCCARGTKTPGRAWSTDRRITRGCAIVQIPCPSRVHNAQQRAAATPAYCLAPSAGGRYRTATAEVRRARRLTRTSSGGLKAAGAALRAGRATAQLVACAPRPERQRRRRRRARQESSAPPPMRLALWRYGLRLPRALPPPPTPSPPPSQRCRHTEASRVTCSAARRRRCRALRSLERVVSLQLHATSRRVAPAPRSVRDVERAAAVRRHEAPLPARRARGGASASGVIAHATSSHAPRP